MADEPEQEDDDPPRFDLGTARRFRAAVAYSGKSEKDIAAALGVAVRTVRRMRSGRAEISHERIDATIKATEVPAWFMEHGFEPPPATEDPDLAERTAALEHKMDSVLQVLSRRVAASVGATGEHPEAGASRTSDDREDR